MGGTSPVARRVTARLRWRAGLHELRWCTGTGAWRPDQLERTAADQSVRDRTASMTFVTARLGLRCSDRLRFLPKKPARGAVLQRLAAERAVAEVNGGLPIERLARSTPFFVKHAPVSPATKRHDPLTHTTQELLFRWRLQPVLRDPVMKRERSFNRLGLRHESRSAAPLLD